MGLPVFTDAAPQLVLHNLHPKLFKLFSQFFNHIADNPAFDFHIGLMVKYVEGAGNIDFQGGGKTLRLLFRLLPQKPVQVAQDGHFLRLRVLQIVPVDQMDTAVDDGFLHRFQTGLSANNQLHQGENKVAL